MIGWLAGLLLPKVGARWAKPLAGTIVWGLGLLIVGFLLWRMIDNYGDKRFDAGVQLERSKWEAAEAKMLEEAAASATKADDRAAERLVQHKEQIDEDRQAVDQAVRDGTSPLDALFGG